MIQENDTICAVATGGTAPSGIAVVRLSGPDAIAIADTVWKGRRLADSKSHTAHFGAIIDPSDNLRLDEAVATLFIGPNSFTGEDTVEFSVHGSLWLQRTLVDILCRQGARLAEPGEFTRRAFLNGRLDLAQAEAVADVIASTSAAAHRLALSQLSGEFSRRLEKLRIDLIELAALLELELDFSEEDVEFASRKKLAESASATLSELNRLHESFATGDALLHGIKVAIVGPTNAGKSSLLNALLGTERAIVSDIHGTTRDIVAETLQLGGFTFRLMDTAGLRRSDDPIEQIGISRSREAAAEAAIILSVSSPDTDDEPLPPTSARIIRISSKADLGNGAESGAIAISTRTGEGLQVLRDALIDAARQLTADADADVIVTNARHAESISRAAQALSRVVDGLNSGLSGDLVAQDLRETTHHLASITGAITTPAILSTIFSRFCIGK